ncbi:low-density lipoprotein receptor-related protein 6-like [Pteropus medius]|uniref:low-density lipoprotein receptor-related protein 6-like n=1 Tax=Pteropus vampyrus TaxID=132908 RepID=UPI00196A76D7|nr:low-density lipoprotein receptor-related protein 6-like [Pteropus giganteus]
MRTIETAGMDGADRKMLAVVNMEEPVGLTLDHVTGRLYWISKYKESIETINVDGSGRHTFPEIFLEDEDLVGLAVFENSFFWTNKIQLLHTSPHTPKERVVLLNTSVLLSQSSTNPNSLRAETQSVLQDLVATYVSCPLSFPRAISVFVQRECFFYLPVGTCSELKLLFSSGKHLYLLKVSFIGTAIEKTLVQEHRRNIYLLDVDWKRNLIYWTNAQDSCSA